MAVRTALALVAARSATTSRFARKNYFYPDLPKGYQISQFDEPFSERGHLDIEVDGAAPRRIGITRVHMEEDAGKNVHHADASRSSTSTASGVPLVEIVGEPDLRSARRGGGVPAHAARRPRLHRRQRRQPRGGELPLRRQREHPARRARRSSGTRVELKNINSFRFVEKAIDARDRAPGGGARRRRAHRAGDARLERGRGDDLQPPQQGGGAGLPLLPGARTCRRSCSTTSSSPRCGRRCPSCRATKRERFVAEMGLTPVRRAGAHGRTRASRRSSRRRRRCTATPAQGRELRPERGAARRDDARARRDDPGDARGRSPSSSSSSTPGPSAASRPRRSTRRSRGTRPHAARTSSPSSGCSR